MTDLQAADAAARERIHHQHGVNMLVEASAGSGKTEALARRMADGLATGAYEVRGLAAVTFTRQAASELRGRLQLCLEKRLATAPPGERSRIEKALAELEHLFAGTIHAFCARLLRERPVEARLTPGFRELEEAEETLVALASFRRYLDGLRGDPRLACLRELAMERHELEPAFLKVCGFPEVDFPFEETPQPEMGPALERALEFRERLVALQPFVEPQTTCKLQRKMRDFRSDTHVPPRTLGRLATAFARLEGQISPPTYKFWGGSRDPEARARADAACREVEEFRERVGAPFLEAVRTWAYAPLMRLLLGGREQYARDREAAGLVNFADLLNRTAELLRTRSDVREALARKFRWLLVDEFQDTDPVQAELLMWLAAEPGTRATDWTRVPLRPGALFVVGDPKQSIYRFRRADISVYQEVRAALGEVLQLTHSFRSRPEVCDWVNGVFRELFPAGMTETQAAYAPLQPGPAEPVDCVVGVAKLTVETDETTADKVARADARLIASWIWGEVRNGRRNYGDFLVLTRNRPRIPLYVAELGRLAIPVEASYAGSVGSNPASRAMLDLLKALVDPEDGVCVVGALRGPFFGISDEELHQHVLEGGRFVASYETERGHGSVLAALARLHRMVRWTIEKTPGAAVEAILEETGALPWAATLSIGGGEAGSLLALVDRLRQAVELGGSLGDAVEDLQADSEGDMPREGVARPLEPGLRDVVRVMNLHVAKGLEAPVVILADPAGGNVFPPDIRIVRHGSSARGYLAIQDGPPWARRVLAHPPDWAWHLAEEERFRDAELDRLLYVATTRAKELLVVSRRFGNGDLRTPSWGKLGPFLRDPVPELTVPETEEVAAQVGRLDPAYDAALRAERREAVRQPTWSRRAVTAVAEEDRHLVLRLLPPPGGDHGVDGASWGSLVHRLLEAAVGGPDRSRPHLGRLAQWYAQDNPDLVALVDEAVATVEGVLASPFGQRILAGERLVEIPFAVRRDGGVLLYGILDLAVKAPEGWEIVDWKTDHRPVQELVQLYGAQVQEYARTWEGLTGERVVARRLYGVVAGEASEDCS